MKLITIFLALTAAPLALPSAAQSLIIHHRHGFPNPPALLARLALESETRIAGMKALRNGDFTTAEADFRESIKADSLSPSNYGLGEALAGQGRITEAIEAYRAGIYGPPYTVAVLNDIPLHGLINPNVRECPGGAGAEAWMKYALLLNQMGQSAEAIVIYQKALPNVPDMSELTHSRFPNAAALSPSEFQAAAHIALGLLDEFGGDNTIDSPDSQQIRAMQQFDKARQLQPDAPITNYYYGFGWQHLYPSERAHYGHAAQAKAALQKAVSLDNGEIKAAAEKALGIAMKP